MHLCIQCRIHDRAVGGAAGPVLAWADPHRSGGRFVAWTNSSVRGVSGMAEVTFGAVCMRCEHDPARNLGRYREFIAEAADRGVQVLVFPEVSVQGYVRKMI